MKVAQNLEQELNKCGIENLIFDYVDPASGILMNRSNANRVYYEITGIEHMLKDYKTKQIGICRVVDHPVYGLDAYPASIFTNAKIEIVQQCLDKIIEHFLQ